MPRVALGRRQAERFAGPGDRAQRRPRGVGAHHPPRGDGRSAAHETTRCFSAGPGRFFAIPPPVAAAADGGGRERVFDAAQALEGWAEEGDPVGDPPGVGAARAVAVFIGAAQGVEPVVQGLEPAPGDPVLRVAGPRLDRSFGRG